MTCREAQTVVLDLCHYLTDIYLSPQWEWGTKIHQARSHFNNCIGCKWLWNKLHNLCIELEEIDQRFRS